MSNEKQKTAVEKFAIALYEKGLLVGNGNEIQESLDEHKEMHKRQIKNAFINGYLDSYNAQNNINADEIFYEKTYGGNK
jgi:hypothetical protein